MDDDHGSVDVVGTSVSNIEVVHLIQGIEGYDVEQTGV